MSEREQMLYGPATPILRSGEDWEASMIRNRATRGDGDEQEGLDAFLRFRALVNRKRFESGMQMPFAQAWHSTQQEQPELYAQARQAPTDCRNKEGGIFNRRVTDAADILKNREGTGEPIEDPALAEEMATFMARTKKTGEPITPKLAKDLIGAAMVMLMQLGIGHAESWKFCEQTWPRASALYVAQGGSTPTMANRRASG